MEKSTIYYTDKLDKLYQEASNKIDTHGQGDDITAARAQEIVTFLQIDFGEYQEYFIQAITGMTQIEVVIYFNQILSEIDRLDGTFDGVIDTRTHSFGELMHRSQFNIDLKSTHTDTKEGQQSALLDHLVSVADTFKQADNPRDHEYVTRINQFVQDKRAQICDQTSKKLDFNSDQSISTAEILAYYGIAGKDISHYDNEDVAIDHIQNAFSSFIHKLYGTDEDDDA